MALILIADDDAATCDLLRRALEAEGHKVVTASDGTEALENIGASGLALLITDVQMPGMDGIALAKAALAKAPGLRVILMSGFTEQLDRATGLTGNVRTLSKPFTLEKARAEVKAALG
jgi:two-component system cell cycle response regulator CpdR